MDKVKQQKESSQHLYKGSSSHIKTDPRLFDILQLLDKNKRSIELAKKHNNNLN